MLKEFREFIARGNVIDLAIGIIIGAAFTKIVDSLVQDVIMPPIGALIGGLSFTDYYLNLSGQTFASFKAARDAGAPVIGYGAFVTAVISFLIVAFVIFLLLKGINQLRREPPVDPTMRDCPYCVQSIPIKATRCPHCTSDLAAASTPAHAYRQLAK